MQSHEKPEAVAYMSARRQDLALGFYAWTVKNDYDCQPGRHVIYLKTTSCKEEEFTCNNGLCISLEERCDSVKHCKDWSDELDCSPIQLPKSYMKQFAPINIVDKEITPVAVVLNVSILDVLDVLEMEGLMELKFSILMSWFDHRITYINLKNTTKNRISRADTEKIWIPQMIFRNTKSMKETVRNDEKVVVSVIRNGSFSFSDIYTVHEMTIFKGGENSLEYERAYFESFQCHFNK